MSCENIPSIKDLERAKLDVIHLQEVVEGTPSGTSTNPVTGKILTDLPTTLANMNAEFDEQILNMGFTRIGTFKVGATMENPRQTLLWDLADGGDGQEYGWSGTFPKVVPPDSTPLTTGGIAVGAWVSRFDPELRIAVREALRRSYAEAGYNLVAGSFEAGGTVTTATDVLLYEAEGKAYSWRGALPKTVPAGSTPLNSGGLSNNAWVSEADSLLVNDLGAPPVDMFIGSFFNSNTDVSLTLFKSFDGVNFSQMNKYPLTLDTGGVVGNRDPSILFHKGKWYVATTVNQDFQIWRSDDLISWDTKICFAGPTKLYGQPGSVIGGTIPSIAPIWAPSLFVDNDELYVQLSVGYHPQTTDIDGTTVNYMVPFSCRCNDLDNLTFDFPVQMISDTSVTRIDVEVTKIPTGYAIAIKNEYNKHIEIWTSATYTGGYTKIADLDFGGVYVEGPCLVWINNTQKWRLYADAFRQNGVTWYVESNDLVSWSSPQRVQAPGPMRHGTVYNIPSSPEANAAIASFVRASAVMDTDTVQPKWAEGGSISAGSNTIVPQCNYVYRVAGSNAATITINEKGGDYFYLLVASGSTVSGITVNGSKVDGAFSIGYGHTNLRLYKMVWNSASGFYQLQGVPNKELVWSGGTLSAGANALTPQTNYVYRVTGSNSATVTIDTKGGDVFYLYVGSGSASAGMTVSGSKVDGQFTIGYGQTNLRVYKLAWNTLTQMYQLFGRPNDIGDAATFSSQTGWPNITETFKPAHGRTYTTSGSDSNNTVIAGLPADLPDGTYFHIWISSLAATGSVTLKAGGANMGIYITDKVLSGSTGNGNLLYTIKKVSGIWRLMAY